MAWVSGRTSKRVVGHVEGRAVAAHNDTEPRRQFRQFVTVIVRAGLAKAAIAMDGGTDLAIETAGITGVLADLRAHDRAVRLRRRTRRNVRQNLALAFGDSLVTVPLAAAVLYPWFRVGLTPTVVARGGVTN